MLRVFDNFPRISGHFAEADHLGRGCRRRQDGEGFGVSRGRWSGGRRSIRGHGGRAQDHRILPSEQVALSHLKLSCKK